MKVECLHTLGEVALLRSQINELNLRCARPDPFSTFEYLASVTRNDPGLQPGGTSTLWFLAAYSNDSLVGYLALKRLAAKVLWRRSFTLGFLVGHDTDRPRVVAEDENFAAVVEAVVLYLRGRNDWDLLELQQQTEDSALHRALQAVPLVGMWEKQWPTMQNHAIAIRWRSLSGYAESLAQKVRAETKRQLRRLFSLGELRLLSTSDPASTEAMLQLYFALEAHSWKATTALAIGKDRARSGFVRDLLSAVPTLQPTIHILLLDGLPIAGLINIALAEEAQKEQKELFALHIAYDNRFSFASPGAAMLLLGIRSAIEGKFAAYNLLSGFGYYKSKLLAKATPTHSIQLYRRGSPLFWRRLFGDARRRLARHKVEERGVDVRDGMEKPTVEMDAQSLRDEASRANHLVEQALRGECVSLSSAELSVLVPLEIKQHHAGDRKPRPIGAAAHAASVATC